MLGAKTLAQTFRNKAWTWNTSVASAQSSIECLGL